MSAKRILNTSDLLIKENCKIVGDVVYEMLDDHEHKYRFFISEDDYDYVEDEATIEMLDNLFNS